MSPAKRRKQSAPFPSREEILRYVQGSERRVGKREIARAFNLDADQKAELKKMLRAMEQDGTLQRGRGKRYAEPGTLPSVAVVEVTGVDVDGEVLAKPTVWEGDGAPPVIYMVPEPRGHPALGAGDKVLARLNPLDREDKEGARTYEGRTIRRLTAAPSYVLGVYEHVEGRGRIRATERGHKADLIVEHDDAGGAEPGDLVRAEVLPGRRLGLKHARVVERVTALDTPKSATLISLHDHGLPMDFPADALKQADTARAAPIGKREDLRGTPLVTIDGADARDFDDAVFAEPDDDPDNEGGWHLIVAIADVAWYVRPGDALDRSAYERGNSAYFPDRVVPMLPEGISNGWCSLVPHEDRPCMAAHMWIDAEGNMRRHRFARAVMRSHARLTYTQVQEARDGAPDEATGPLAESVIAPLYGAYDALVAARRRRGVLELDLPERRVVLDEHGNVERIETRERYDSHRLIEEFMIAANVAAAETLERKRQPCMYRVHDQPSLDKVEALREFLATLDIRLPRGQVMRAGQFNAILDKARGSPHAEIVNAVVLRSQSQAEYSPDNIGHFGLNLRRYAHFTSPIRRYSDLLVHRALVRGLRLGPGGLEDEHRDFSEAGEHLSQTERRAMAAERDAVDRYTAAYLAGRVGARFDGRIGGVTRFGLFVTLGETGADGLLPIGALGDDYFVHDERMHCLRGRRTGDEYRLGQRLPVVLAEADPITGGLLLRPADGAQPAGGRGGKPRVQRKSAAPKDRAPRKPKAKKDTAKSAKGRKTNKAGKRGKR